MKKLEKIVVATRNPAKVDHYRKILLSIAEEVLGLNDLEIEGKPTEEGATAEENAEIKARFYGERCGFPVFTEDESLYVDFLEENEQPGVHVRRINGHDEVDDETLLSHWEKITSEVPENKRTGRWHIAYCIFVPEAGFKTVSLDHEIMFFSPVSKIRIPGWPMSSIEGSAFIGKPHSEQTEEERNVSDERSTQELKTLLEVLL